MRQDNTQIINKIIFFKIETNKVKIERYLMRQDNTIYKFSIKLSFS